MARKKGITIKEDVGISDNEIMGAKNQTIKDMNLTSEQKKGLIHAELERIFAKRDSIEGVRTTTEIQYPVEESGTMTVSAIFNVDSRISQMAWDFYRDNAEKPTVKEFIDEMASIVGIKEYHRRVIRLNLN